MTWDGVPWAIGGGQAEHSANIGRNLAHAAFNGREGVVSPTDLEVRELPVPGSFIRVYPGTCAIKSRGVGAQDEMYVGRLITEDVLPVVSTNAGAGRSDLVVAIVKDPYLPGSSWDVPATPKVGPYVATMLITNVPATTTNVSDLGLGYSAVALARIDIPPSTGTITQAMITDLRELSRHESARSLNLVVPTAAATLNSSTYTNWPPQSNTILDVPSWATHVKVLANLGGVGFGAAGTNGGAGWNVAGDLRIQIGSNATDTNYSPATHYNISNDGGADRATMLCGAVNLSIPKTLRGKPNIGIRVEGRKSSGNTSLVVDTKSIVAIDVEFTTKRESNI